ncbi:hypothetical protein ACQZV8_10240 [Magnetococcales bacterium HHB-1]
MNETRVKNYLDITRRRLEVQKTRERFKRELDKEKARIAKEIFYADLLSVLIVVILAMFLKMIGYWTPAQTLINTVLFSLIPLTWSLWREQTLLHRRAKEIKKNIRSEMRLRRPQQQEA